MRFLTCVLGALFMLGLVVPGEAQDGSLGLTISLDRTRVHQKDTESLIVVIEMRNQLDEPLRLHYPRPAFTQEIYQAQLRIQGSDGQRYNGGRSGCGFFLGERTTVFAPGASGFLADVLSRVIRTNPQGLIDWEEGQVTFDDELLPPGEYQVWLEYGDGPVLGGEQPGRAPELGVYTSNRARLTVLPDDQPIAPTGGLARRKGEDIVLVHRGIGLVRGDALTAYGVKVRRKGQRVVVSRGARVFELPMLSDTPYRPAPGGSPLPAFGLNSEERGPDYFVPLRWMAERLGFRLHYDPTTRLYDLR